MDPNILRLILLGIELARRHFENTGRIMTKEEAEAAALKEYQENNGDLAAWFISKGLTPPE